MWIVGFKFLLKADIASVKTDKEELRFMAKKVVLAGACRTAIGKMGGGLSTTPAPVLGSIVIKEALKRAEVPADQVDHVYGMCYPGRFRSERCTSGFSIKAGLPVETPAVTVNVVCGSGLNCVNMAAQMIQAGDADIVSCRWYGKYVYGTLCYDAGSFRISHEQRKTC